MSLIQGLVDCEDSVLAGRMAMQRHGLGETANGPDLGTNAHVMHRVAIKQCTMRARGGAVPCGIWLSRDLTAVVEDWGGRGSSCQSSP
jgi:hypothetical protein